MHIGQILLLIVLVFFVFYVFRVRKLVFDRIIFVTGAFLGIVLVFFPQLSSIIANWLGIGRGVDLIIYIFMIFCLFFFVSISAEVRNLKSQITDLAQLQALANPIRGENRNPAKAKSQYNSKKKG